MHILLKRKWPIFIGIAVLVIALLCFPLSRVMRRDELFKESIFAIEKGDVAQMRKLLQMGAPVDGVDGAFVSGTPLIWASENGDLPMIRLLIHSGANVNKQSTDGVTALMCARNANAVQLLLSAGANPLTTTDKGGTAWLANKKAKDEKTADIIHRAAEKWRASHGQSQ